MSTLIKYSPYFLAYMVKLLGEEPKVVISDLPLVLKDKKEQYKEVLKSVLR
ncbi:hypothetical protein [Aquifex aeolicus]|uniref:hypothetical protein n=1 Tax=Aquifex aeolicus TaxID=63363 RepID=UPI00030EFBB5|nr:hypothetical protein [Aquifex aeolicus]